MKYGGYEVYGYLRGRMVYVAKVMCGMMLDVDAHPQDEKQCSKSHKD